MIIKLRTLCFRHYMLFILTIVTILTLAMPATAREEVNIANVIEQSDALNLKDPSLALKYLEKQYNKDRSSIAPSQEIQYLSRLANYHLYTSDGRKALDYIDRAYQVMPKLSGYNGTSIMLSHGIVLFNQGDNSSAIDKVFNAIAIAKAEKNYELLANAYHTIAWHYTKQNDDANALRYYSLAYASVERLNDATELAFLQAQMFRVYVNLHDIDMATSLLKKAIKHFSDNDMPFDLFNSLNDLAQSYKKQSNDNGPQIITLYERMISLASSLSDSNSIYHAYIGLTDTYTTMLSLEKAANYWRLAQQYIDHYSEKHLIAKHYIIGANLAIKMDDSQLAQQYLAILNEKISPAYIRKDNSLYTHLLTTRISQAVLNEDFQSAYHIQSELLELHRTNNTHMRECIRSRLKIQFDTQQKDLQNQLLAKNQKISQIELERLKQSKHIERGVLIISMVIVLVLLLFIYRQIKSSQYLKALANTDSLTKIANRRAIFSFASQYIQRIGSTGKGQLSLIIYDIDHFKSINDTFGHSTGDQVLINVAELSKEQLRSNDLLGRIGGEEFLAVLTDTSSEQALEVAERLRRTIEAASIDSTSQEIKVTASFGVVQYHDGVEDINSLFQQADELLYQAKAQGRNHVSSEF